MLSPPYLFCYFSFLLRMLGLLSHIQETTPLNIPHQFLSLATPLIIPPRCPTPTTPLSILLQFLLQVTPHSVRPRFPFPTTPLSTPRLSPSLTLPLFLFQIMHPNILHPCHSLNMVIPVLYLNIPLHSQFTHPLLTR